MVSESSLLWPRHEVLQLINPVIPQAGKALSQGFAIDAVRQLAKMRSPDGSISFHQWYSVAKDLLKWNDHFIRLFWDMLHIATWYRQKNEWSQHSDFVQCGYLVVFLIMHVTVPPRASSPTNRQPNFFECIWPPSNVDVGSSTSIGSPPTSPIPSHRKHVGGNGSAPLSPRQSPRDRSGGGSTSPRKQLSPRLNTATTFVRSHAQHLLVLREKIPLLLYALSLQGSVTAEHKEEMSSVNNTGGDNESPLGVGSHKRPSPSGEGESGVDQHGSTGSAMRREDSPLFLATMSCNALDALGLLIGGGDSKKQEVALLSLLFRLQADGSAEDQAGSRYATGSPSSGGDSESSLRCAQVADWMELRLQLNDVLYPPSPVFGANSSPTSSGGNSPHSPGADIAAVHNPNAISEFSSPGSPTTSPSSSSSSASGGCGPVVFSDHNSVTIPALQSGLPIRQVINIDSPQCREPTVLHGTGSSAFHILKMQGSGLCSTDEHDTNNQSKLKSLGHLDDDESELVLLDDHYEDMSNVRQHKGRRNTEGGGRSNNVLARERYGPVLLSNCSRTSLYLLSAYTFASVSSCSDSEMVLGAVAGVVVMSGCERVQLTVACRKLILWNCKDCDIRLATLTPTIVSGDCRGLTFGPFNTTYRHLRSHLRLANLEALIVASKSTLANVGSNCWNEIYDINTCADLDSPTPRDRSNSDDSASGQMGNNNNGRGGLGTVQLQSYPTMTSGLTSLPPPPDSVLTILNPEKYVFLPIPYTAEFQPQEMCPTITPEAYLEAYMRKKQASVTVRENIQVSLHKQKVEKDIDCERTFNHMLSHQFLEWLTKTGKAPGLLDLIRLDAEEKVQQSDVDVEMSGGEAFESGGSGSMLSKNSW